MRKSIFILGAVGALACASWWLFLRSPDRSIREAPAPNAEDFRKAARKLGRIERPQSVPLRPIGLNQMVRLGIGSLGFADEEQDRRVSDLVSAELSGTRGLDLVERQSLDRVLNELNLSLSGLTRAKDAVRVGKLLKADWFLFGTTARIHGTNFVVLRLVDARTGILRDAGVSSADGRSTQLASSIASFVRQSRQDAASAKSHVYLSVGTFEDLSLNNRLSRFPTQLRAYLNASYQGGDVTLLEREYVETLLQEARLDLAGLAEGSETNAVQPMQSAFWLVEGYYQSYETTNLEVELALEVRRIFGTRTHRILRGPPDEPLLRQVKAGIDTAMKDSANAVIPTRVSEARAQLYAGKEMAQLDSLGSLFFVYYQDLDRQEFARQRRNAEEAIRAFQTVLLLEPTNREAKIYLAGCLRKQTIQRLDEARDLYREILDEPVQDKWTGLAGRALHYSFQYSTPDEKIHWYESALRQYTNSPNAGLFRKEIEAATSEAVLNNGGSAAQKLAEAHVFETITNAMLGDGAGNAGVDQFVESFGTNRVAAAERLAVLYRGWKEKFPELAPYLAAAVVSVQEDTNAAVVAEFQKMLDTYAAHPEQVFRPDQFWWHIDYPIRTWSFDHKLYRMAASLFEGKIRATAMLPHNPWPSDEESKMGLAFAYLRLEQWRKALDIFQTYSNRPVQMENSGPWGQAFSVVFTEKQVAYCRQKLGLAPEVNPFEFEMGKPLLCLCTPSTFTADDKGLWVGINGQLLELDFSLRTNQVVRLPIDASTQITAINVNSSKVYVGTAGDGLIAYDKSSHTARHFTVENGLMMNSISCMSLDGDILWIGYGRPSGGIVVGVPGGGGIGYMNVADYKFISFTPSIENGPDTHKTLTGNRVLESGNEPTRRAVHALAASADGDVWFLTANHPLRRYNAEKNVWSGTDVNVCSSLALDSDHLVVGQYWNSWGNSTNGLLGVSIMNFKDSSWRQSQNGKWTAVRIGQRGHG